MTSLQDAVVVVTGGGTGVGRSLALEAASRGARIVIASRSDASESVAMIRAAGGTAEWTTTDVADYASVEELREFVLATYGQVNVLINNAASGGEAAGLHAADPEKARELFDVNVQGVFNGIRVFSENLIAAAKAGQPAYILNVGSEHSLGVPPYVAAMSTYTVSKYATLGFTDVAARDLEPSGVGVSLLAPGWVRTERVIELIKADPAMAKAIEPYAQSGEEVAQRAFDDLLEGVRIIATNPKSREFAMQHARDVMSDLQRLPVADSSPDADGHHVHDGTGDPSKCPVPHIASLMR